MKFILFILLLPAFSLCQDPPKKTNTIKVTGVDFKTAATLLLDQGYMIEKSDTSLGFMMSAPKMVHKAWSGNLKINVRMKDSTAIITGLYNMNVNLSTVDLKQYEPVENIGMKGSVIRTAFEALDKYAKSFGRPVEYLVIK